MLPQPFVDLALVVAAYLLGSLPMGVIVARLTGAPDPRTVGSGRIGGTNALRAMGFRRALAVGVLDIAKGALPVLLATLLGTPPWTRVAAGLAAVLGAWRSVFLRFHGGRGVASGIGATLIVQPLLVLIAAPIFFGVIWLTRYVSLGSLVGSVAGGLLLIPFVLAGLNPPADLALVGGGVALIWLAHSDNITRLIRGKERRFDVLARGNDS
ncbi:MAG: glycerol-3-phosphate 1-O-acyltransferase PlsY [Chloroflexota bacterium]|nr:glycerol-3-phosphate 1-O-acyltransferase PlsY [Chloroflexota bacterium]